MTKSTGRRITAADREAAARLKRIWEQAQHKRPGLTQEKAAHDLGWTQGMVHQYLSGKTPLGTDATLKWAAYLGVDPVEIRDDLAGVTSLAMPGLDMQLLTQVIHDVEEILQERGTRLSFENHAKLIAATYRESLKTRHVDKDIIRYRADVLQMQL